MMATTGIHLPNTLKFVETTGDGYSVYTTPDDRIVLLADGTGREVWYFDDLDILDRWGAWKRDPARSLNHARGYGWNENAFMDALREATIPEERDRVDEEIEWCTDYRCGDPVHQDDSYRLANGDVICEDCRSNYYWLCWHCEELCAETTTIGDREVCEGCRDDRYNFCEECDEYYDAEYGCGGDHSDGDCDCEAPAQEFTIRNDGNEPLANDTFTTIELPAGVISEEGITQIRSAIYSHRSERMYTDGVTNEEMEKWYLLASRIEEIGAAWQTKQGNFTKRLSRFAYKEFGLKVPPTVISTIGNIGAQHSTGNTYKVAVTRDLNLPREEFANEGSCWWSDYSESRCALKSNGGFGLRSFEDTRWNGVNGRAWVMPLKQEGGTLTPTFNTEDPDAFVVFNGYEALSGYTGARIMAHMVGMTYRKITFVSQPMYINSEAGYLVAPEEIAEPYTDGALRLKLQVHADLWDTENNKPCNHDTEKELAHA